MNRLQIIISIALIYFIFTNQALAFNHSAKTDLIKVKFMQHIQNFFGLTLIYFALVSQSLAISPFVSGKDDVDEIIQTAKTSLVLINDNIRTSNLSIQSKLNQMESLFDKSRQSEITKIKQIAASKRKTKELADLIKELQKQCERIREEIKNIQKEIEAEEQKLEDLEKSRIVFNKVSEDRVVAERITDLIRSKNLAGLESFLRSQTSENSTEVVEIKDTNGFTVIFRFNRSNNCFSTKNQCGGKTYSISQ